MKAQIRVTLKAGVLDPQGKAIQNALSGLGFAGVESVRDLFLDECFGADGFLTWRALNEPYAVAAPDYGLGEETSCRGWRAMYWSTGLLDETRTASMSTAVAV